MDHLNALYQRLSNEKVRLNAAKTVKDREYRGFIVQQVEREIQGELKFLGLSDTMEHLNTLSSDELLNELSN